MSEEKELVLAMQKGSHIAFDALYSRYRDLCLRSIWLITYNISDSEDIVQETFVKCFLHIKDLKDPEGFKPWLFQILYRTAWGYVKKRKRETPQEAPMENCQNFESSCLEHMMENEKIEAVQQAIRKLSEKYRAVIVLHYFSDLSVRDIAKVEGCFEGTVKSRLAKARKLLKISLKKTNEGMQEESSKSIISIRRQEDTL